ncbi:MAG: M23 family metallopeptidase [Parasphingopyxis sp.]|uniref:M23 family metallopeptidase n=1 Tax=Parasphingopyxis sp. TaxID=1920299 RepID=UPI003F9F13BD
MSAESSDVRALFASWRQNERQRRGVMAIPSLRPVEGYRLTSSFGTRDDPFRRGRRMHNGLDMAGPIGTPIYATADGIVGRAQWLGGYGKYVEINHGGEIQTRYGHMSQILVEPGARVTRGQLIGRMGSTGRSTGSHLHYEVRIAGRPVNPMPFLTSGQYLAQLASATSTTEGATAMGASQ